MKKKLQVIRKLYFLKKKKILQAKLAKCCIGEKLCWVDISSLPVFFFFCPQMLAVLYGNKGVSL